MKNKVVKKQEWNFSVNNSFSQIIILLVPKPASLIQIAACLREIHKKMKERNSFVIPRPAYTPVPLETGNFIQNFD